MGRPRIKIKKDRPRRYTLQADGSKTVPLGPEAMQVFEAQRVKFREKFGREPEPEDPIFFDPDAETPRFLRDEQIEASKKAALEVMASASIPAHIIYAYSKTDRLVTEQNMANLTDAELREWNDAVSEYFEKEREQRTWRRGSAKGTHPKC